MKTTQRIANFIFVLLTSILLTACLEEDSDENGGQAGLAINFTNPADTTFIQTPDIVVVLTGTVAAASEIDLVEWKNSRGGLGNANGNETWTTGNIVLQVGENVITVTARDVEGQITSKTLTVEREGPAGAVASNDDDTPAANGTATLSWQSPTVRADGTSLGNNLAGFNIYYGQDAGSYDRKIVVNSPGITTYMVENLGSGTWHFVLTAFDSDGVESDRSNMKSRTL